MSLLKQLLMGICLVLLVAFAGSVVVSFESSRAQSINQLRSHAQDAATSLALSLTPNIDDPAMVELLASSIFDSGYYTRIRVVNLATNAVMVERGTTLDNPQVPQWFIDCIGLDAAGAEAIVSRGWQPAARVEVVSNPVFTQTRLWQSVLGTLGWLMVCGVVSALLGALLLRRQLKPLDYMVAQSQAIARREFLTLSKLPRTPELRRVVEAMNQMVEKLKALFKESAERSEKLRIESYQDSLTGLSNRRYFDMQLKAHVSNQEEHRAGHLLLLRVRDLAGLNLRLGGKRTDALLVAVAQVLLEQCDKYPQTRNLISRSRGGEFAVLAPGMAREQALALAEDLEQALKTLSATGASDVSPVAHMGVAPYTPGEAPLTLLGLADQALSQAETQGERTWNYVEKGEVTELTEVTEDQHTWHRVLDHALTHGSFELFFQPVVATHDTGQVLHHKALSRLVHEQGHTISAGRFLPWVERFGWSSRLDLLMLHQVLRHLDSHGQPLALNLSAATLNDPAVLNQVFDALRQHPKLGGKLTIEIGEEQLPDQAVLEQLTRRLQAAGFTLALQRFGGRFSMIGNLAHLGLAYLKIDGSYIRAIDEESHKRLFIEAVQRAAHSIDLPLIAERVETEGEHQVIAEMGIKGVQGRLFGDPAPWT
ncbi:MULTISPECIES: cyclic di-GMP receptor LapD [unclassified Pseudomonas]|uniref:cyclic di-GMP receptor LapD n=1 Tax=unclassified Pseudomonas TaxID=196821 RepID=UPI0025E26A62|nr:MULTISPECIES: EAL domain-containing protein [unclassified Pseudomonas]